MPHPVPRLGVLFALLIGVLTLVFSHETTTTSAVSTAILSTTSQFPATPLSATSSIPGSRATSATTTQKASLPTKGKQSAVKPAKTVAQPVQATPVSTPMYSPTIRVSSGSVPLDAVASALRSALVNIVCYAPIGSNIHSMSGSGVFIDAKGIILTNAHVAQYFLLADRGVSCTIRSGSPAVDRYDAALIYLSPAWVHANAGILTQVAPSGTGEYDFALLAITKSVTSDALPASFPSIPLAELPPSPNAPVVIASYGAQFLETSQIQYFLSPTVVFGSIRDVFTFATSTLDVFAISGSVASQEGSSGGGIADASGSLVGTITTSTVQGATNTRSLGAITASYIRSEYAHEMGTSLDVLLSEPTSYAISDFAPQIPLLEKVITSNL